MQLLCFKKTGFHFIHENTSVRWCKFSSNSCSWNLPGKFFLKLKVVVLRKTLPLKWSFQLVLYKYLFRIWHKFYAGKYFRIHDLLWLMYSEIHFYSILISKGNFTEISNNCQWKEQNLVCKTILEYSKTALHLWSGHLCIWALLRFKRLFSSSTLTVLFYKMTLKNWSAVLYFIAP